MKIKSDVSREWIINNLDSQVYGVLSNGDKFYGYRSTLFAYLNRGYHKQVEDVITRVYII